MSIYEYGNSAMVYSLSAGMIARLQKYFPDRWADLYALSVVGIMDPVPLKSVKDKGENLCFKGDRGSSINKHPDRCPQGCRIRHGRTDASVPVTHNGIGETGI